MCWDDCTSCSPQNKIGFLSGGRSNRFLQLDEGKKDAQSVSQNFKVQETYGTSGDA